jgi:NAD(P)H-hydrate epimerase
MNLKALYPKRNTNSHKGDFGYVLIVAGSKMYSGSPIFNAMAALRSGADLVTVVGHKRAMDIASGFSPDIITWPLEGELHLSDFAQIREMSKKFDVVVMGGGLSRTRETYDAICEIVENLDLPMVLDAEAIRAIGTKTEIIKNKGIILTPNVPEFEILTGEMVAESLEERKAQVQGWAKYFGVVIALKGAPDIISNGKIVAINGNGNSFMTKGGFGDTLSGICGALVARQDDLFLAAQAACYLNGKAGDLATKKFGEGLLASDILDYIPEAIRKN